MPDTTQCVQGYELHETDLWEARRPGQLIDHSGVRETQADLAESIRPFIGSTKTLTPAVLLLMQFSDTAAVHFSAEKLMGQLVAQGQSRLAEEWAKSLGHSFQVLLSSCCPGVILLVNPTHHYILYGISPSRHAAIA